MHARLSGHTGCILPRNVWHPAAYSHYAVCPRRLRLIAGLLGASTAHDGSPPAGTPGASAAASPTVPWCCALLQRLDKLLLQRRLVADRGQIQGHCRQGDGDDGHMARCLQPVEALLQRLPCVGDIDRADFGVLVKPQDAPLDNLGCITVLKIQHIWHAMEGIGRERLH